MLGHPTMKDFIRHTTSSIGNEAGVSKQPQHRDRSNVPKQRNEASERSIEINVKEKKEKIR